MSITDLPEETRLIQLAEESAEVAQAALKLIRAASGDTPVSAQAARQHLIEEIADVQLCADMVISDHERAKVRAIRNQKLERWRARINDDGGTPTEAAKMPIEAAESIRAIE